MNNGDWERLQDILMAGYVGERKGKSGVEIKDEMLNDVDFMNKLFPSSSNRKTDDAIYQHILFIRNILKHHEDMDLPKKYEFERA
jgi:hypothetical protein